MIWNIANEKFISIVTKEKKINHNNYEFTKSLLCENARGS
jgi:hypothetical protein